MKLLAVACCALALTVGCSDLFPTPTPVTPVSPSAPPAPARAQGCVLSAGGSGSIVCGEPSSFGDPVADQSMQGEVAYQAYFWSGIPARVRPFLECGGQRNAMAPHDRAEILYGVNLFRSLWKGPAYGLDIAGVLAHEWAHRLQIQNGWITNPVRNMELEADAFAGFYIGLAKPWGWYQVNDFYRQVFSIGDYAFNDPNHHGTPAQRLAAAQYGFDVGTYSLANRRPFSWMELHQMFATRAQILDSGAPVPQSLEIPEAPSTAGLPGPPLQ